MAGTDCSALRVPTSLPAPAVASLSFSRTLPLVAQSSTPVKVRLNPAGPVTVTSYAWSSATGTVTVRVSPAATVCSAPASSKVYGSSPRLAAVTSTPPSAQFFRAVSAGAAPVSAQVAVARAVTVDSLEPARIWVWVRSVPAKARPTGTEAVAWTPREAVPSAVSFGTSK